MSNTYHCNQPRPRVGMQAPPPAGCLTSFQQRLARGGVQLRLAVRLAARQRLAVLPGLHQDMERRVAFAVLRGGVAGVCSECMCTGVVAGSQGGAVPVTDGRLLQHQM